VGVVVGVIEGDAEGVGVEEGIGVEAGGLFSSV
jgi:hypothetical protein